MAAGRKNVHVVPDGSGGWKVSRQGAERASSRHSTQADAIDRARTTARSEKGEVFIHRPDGRIRDRDSYGNDPCPPRDKK